MAASTAILVPAPKTSRVLSTTPSGVGKSHPMDLVGGAKGLDPWTILAPPSSSSLKASEYSSRLRPMGIFPRGPQVVAG